MPVSTPAPPPDCQTAFVSGLPAFLSGGPPGASEIFVGKTAPIPSVKDVGLGITAAVQIFSLSLQQLAHGPAAFRAAPRGWNLFAGTGQDTTIVGRLVERRHAWKLVGVNYGPLVWRTLEGIRQMTKSPPAQLATDPYVLRFLTIPGLNLQLFWLSSSSGSGDWVVGAPSGSGFYATLQLDSPREVSNIFPQLRAASASVLTMDAKAGA